MDLQNDPEIIANGTKVASGAYEILSHLAMGGMAHVYVALQTKLNRRVALKVLNSTFCSNHAVSARFINEALIVAQLHHPHIVEVYDVGEMEDHRLFMAMELLEGKGLGERIHNGIMQPEEALPIIREVAESLAEAHAKGVIHRDLKPDNIFLTTKSGVKTLDFGIAKILHGDVTTSTEEKLTRIGTAPGTPEYMSPEQARGQQLDARSDLYSLGIVLYEMLTGHPPFEESTFLATILKQVQEVPPALPSSIPAELSDYIINKLLAKDPDSRPASAELLIKDIDELSQKLYGTTAGSVKEQSLIFALSEIESLRSQLAQTQQELQRSRDMACLEISDLDASPTPADPVPLVPSALLGGGVTVKPNLSVQPVNTESRQPIASAEKLEPLPPLPGLPSLKFGKNIGVSSIPLPASKKAPSSILPPLSLGNISVAKEEKTAENSNNQEKLEPLPPLVGIADNAVEQESSEQDLKQGDAVSEKDVSAEPQATLALEQPDVEQLQAGMTQPQATIALEQPSEAQIKAASAAPQATVALEQPSEEQIKAASAAPQATVALEQPSESALKSGIPQPQEKQGQPQQHAQQLQPGLKQQQGVAVQPQPVVMQSQGGQAQPVMVQPHPVAMQPHPMGMPGQPMRSGVMPVVNPQQMNMGGQPMRSGVMPVVNPQQMNMGGQAMRSGVMPVVNPQQMNPQQMNMGGLPMRSGVMPVVNPQQMNPQQANMGGQPMRSGVMPVVNPQQMNPQQMNMGGQAMRSGVMPAVNPQQMNMGGQPMRSGVMPVVNPQQMNMGGQPMRSGVMPAVSPNGEMHAQNMPSNMEPVQGRRLGAPMAVAPAPIQMQNTGLNNAPRQPSQMGMPPVPGMNGMQGRVRPMQPMNMQGSVNDVISGVPEDTVVAPQAYDVIRSLGPSVMQAQSVMNSPQSSMPLVDQDSDEVWHPRNSDFYNGCMRDDAPSRPVDMTRKPVPDQTLEDDEDQIVVPRPRFASSGGVPSRAPAGLRSSSGNRKFSAEKKRENGYGSDDDINYNSRPRDVYTTSIRRNASECLGSSIPKNTFMTFAQPLSKVFDISHVEDMLHFAQGIWNAATLGGPAIKEIKDVMRDNATRLKLVEGMIGRKQKIFADEKWLVDDLEVKVDNSNRVSLDFVVIEL